MANILLSVPSPTKPKTNKQAPYKVRQRMVQFIYSMMIQHHSRKISIKLSAIMDENFP